jgi:uncharacterized protein YceK
VKPLCLLLQVHGQPPVVVRWDDLLVANEGTGHFLPGDEEDLRDGKTLDFGNGSATLARTEADLCRGCGAPIAVRALRCHACKHSDKGPGYHARVRLADLKLRLFALAVVVLACLAGCGSPFAASTSTSATAPPDAAPRTAQEASTDAGATDAPLPTLDAPGPDGDADAGCSCDYLTGPGGYCPAGDIVVVCRAGCSPTSEGEAPVRISATDGDGDWYYCELVPADAGHPPPKDSGPDACAPGICGLHLGVECGGCPSDQGCSTFSDHGAWGTCGGLPNCDECGEQTNAFGQVECGCEAGTCIGGVCTAAAPDAGAFDAGPACTRNAGDDVYCTTTGLGEAFNCPASPPACAGTFSPALFCCP